MAPDASLAVPPSGEKGHERERKLPARLPKYVKQPPEGGRLDAGEFDPITAGQMMGLRRRGKKTYETSDD